jgi:hypothetical protein
MPKKIQLLILPALLSTFIYAIDLNHTDEILNNAVEAIQTIEVQMNEALSSPIIEINEEPITIIETEIITLPPMIVEELNITTITVPMNEGNTTLRDEYSHILTIPTVIETTGNGTL